MHLSGSLTPALALAGITLSSSALAQAPAPPIEARFEGEGVWTIKEGGREICTIPCTASVPAGTPLELHPVKIVSGDLGQRRYLPVKLDVKNGPRQVVAVTHPRDWAFTGVGIGATALGATFLALGVIPFHRYDGTAVPTSYRVLSSVGGGLVMLGGILILTVFNPHGYSTRVQPAAAPPTAGVAPRLSFGRDGIGFAF